MSGTKIGGQRAAQTNKARHGDDFYKVIGGRGGRNGHTGGFFADRELARRAGAIGGKISKRKPTPKCANCGYRTLSLDEMGLCENCPTVPDSGLTFDPERPF